ncbi:hypothetical protein RRG08_008423 [Elysia crispata]|uniref:Uncharacterized protein n=1 Tax=Elysia crispata TaxID=231223 RepID=A0AAE0ZJ86_9GAST|nr:hypothetical protein RRG08_008423 [Elysia crispata]
MHIASRSVIDGIHFTVSSAVIVLMTLCLIVKCLLGCTVFRRKKSAALLTSGQHHMTLDKDLYCVGHAHSESCYYFRKVKLNDSVGNFLWISRYTGTPTSSQTETVMKQTQRESFSDHSHLHSPFNLVSSECLFVRRGNKTLVDRGAFFAWSGWTCRSPRRYSGSQFPQHVKPQFSTPEVAHPSSGLAARDQWHRCSSQSQRAFRSVRSSHARGGVTKHDWTRI